MLKDFGVDPAGGEAYSRYERVRVERVYTEAIDKEGHLREASRQRTGPPRFVMNCSNAQQLGSLLRLKHSHSRLEVVADKVEKQSPEERESSEGFDPRGYEAKQMRRRERVPTQKTDLPCTRAQEIGWLLSHPSTASFIREKSARKNLPGSNPALAHWDPQGPPVVPPPVHAVQHSNSEPSLATSPPEGDPLRALDLLNSRRFYKPKTFCPITKYADTYVSLMHHDPFHQSATR